jgi:hypothetical protein
MGVLAAGIASRNSLRDFLPNHGIISVISKGYGDGGGVGNSLDPYTSGP